MRHVERRHAITLAAPVARVFPLFTPRGEERWIAEWRPDYIHPSDGETVEGMVFRTGQGDDLTLWSCLAWEPAAHHVRYARVTPASRFGFVDVRCMALDAGRTEAVVTYTFTALNDAGEAWLDTLTAPAFAAMIDVWRAKIDAWLAANT